VLTHRLTTRVGPTAHPQVYDSLKDSGEMPEASLAYFDADGAEASVINLKYKV